MQGEIGLSLWLRVWPWADFIHTHRKQLEDRIEFLPERTFYTSLALFVGAFFNHPATYDLIFAEQRFWACVIKFWTFLTEFEEPNQRFVMLGHLSGFLADSRLRSYPERLDHMIDAAGSIGRLARLVADFIRTIVTHYTSEARRPIPRRSRPFRYFLSLFLPGRLVYFDTVVAYRDALDEVRDLLLGDDFKKTRSVLYGTWQVFLSTAEERCDALASYQSPSFEARKACDYPECGLIQESSCLKRCCGCQVFYYCSVECQRSDWERSHHSACGTHDSLLLSQRAALTFSERSYIRTLTHQTYLKKRRHLPDALFTLFDYSKPSPVMKVYPVHLDDAEASGRVWLDDEEAHEPLKKLLDAQSHEWQNLVKRAKLGRGRYQLHAIRISEGSKMKMWVVPLRTDGDKRFEGLLRLSQKMGRGLMQATDFMGEIDLLLKYCYLYAPFLGRVWRDYLRSYRSVQVHQTRTPGAALNFNERSFIRALVQHKYLKERRQLPHALFALFDFSKPSSVITVCPVDLDNVKTQRRLHELLDTKSDEWKDLVNRANVGEGRYQLHAIRISETRTWVVPLRADKNEVFDRLVMLSQMIRRGLLGEAALMGQIDFLLQSTNGMVEIH
ncbi:hypothetical protein FB45DRAFT_1065555 [Roridomyces roridus]|uniref:MYND-type domain-containing protein n=1 Tax=Roridomyces roridus TaxID=1738132 RepID=A0AAD7B759_9AGAR|nr:hypothetical protein FB45DRAFT_1065555 [Roridomyces roridus]